jgi:preprotein translocase subunit YajC
MTLETDKAEKTKKSPLSRLPTLGSASRIILIFGFFVIVFVALFIVGRQQVPKQAELRLNIANLERGLTVSTQTDASGNLGAQIKQVEAQIEAGQALFPAPDQTPEMMDRLLTMAKEYELDVTSTSMSTTKETLKVGGKKIPYDAYTFNLQMEGLAPNFQNFLLALDEGMPTARIKTVSIAIAKKKGDPDKAAVTLEVLTYRTD